MIWFAPGASRAVNRQVGGAYRGNGQWPRLYGCGCFFFIPLIIFIAFKAILLAIWIACLAIVWAVQIAVIAVALPVVVPLAVRKTRQERQHQANSEDTEARLRAYLTDKEYRQ